jgi:hypothetical protein
MSIEQQNYYNSDSNFCVNNMNNQNHIFKADMDKMTVFSDETNKTEIIDMDILNKLSLNNKLFNSYARNDIQKLKHIIGSTPLKEYILNVQYKCDNSGYGRLYANCGMQKQFREIRSIFSNKYYWDIDIENAHYNILLNICKYWTHIFKIEKNQYKYIEEYCNNRDQYLNSISDNRDFSKLQFTIILYGGKNNFESDFKEDSKAFHTNILKDETYNIKNNEILEKIKYEVNFIKTKVVEMYKDVLYNKSSKLNKQFKDKKNPEFSLFALYLQSIERNILLCVERFFKNKGREMHTYIHDGGHITKKPNELIFPETELIELSEFVQICTGFKLKFINKPFKSSEIQNILNMTNLETSYVYPDYIRDDIYTDDFYKKMYEFEKSHFLYRGKIYHIGKLIEDKDTGILYRQGDYLLSESLANIDLNYITYTRTIRYKDKIVEKETSFFKEWIKNKYIRRYSYIEFNPSKEQDINENTYNYFNGLAIFNEITYKKDEIEKMKIPIFEETKLYDYIYNVICTSNNELYEYICNLIYKLLFNRGILPGILLSLYNENKGTGKSLFCNFLSSLIGEEYSCKTDKPDNLFSNFNALIRFKLLVCLEESNIKIEHMDTVKDYITSTKITTTKKFEDTIQTQNYALFCQTTNTLPWIEDGCRRIKIIQTSSHRKGDTLYWSELLQEMETFEYKYSFYKYIEQNYKNNYDQMYFQNNFPETSITSQIKKDNSTPFVSFLIYITETYMYINSSIESGEPFENFEDIEKTIYNMYKTFEKNNNSGYVKTKEIYDIYTHFHTYIKNQDRKYMIPMNKFGNNLSNENYNIFIDKKVLHHQSIYKIDHNKLYEYLKNLGKI